MYSFGPPLGWRFLMLVHPFKLTYLLRHYGSVIVNGLFLLAAVLKNKPFLKNIHKNTVKFFDILGL